MKHKTPTLNQKIRIYKKALYLIEKDKQIGICASILYAQIKLHMRIDKDDKYSDLKWKIAMENTDNNIQVNFPELVGYKPRNKPYYKYWWGTNEKGKQMRISVLRGIISTLEAERKHI
jgi:hypothetical protein